MRQHRGLSEGGLGPEERNLQRLLLREAGRHDLAEQPHDLLIAQRAAVALARPAQHLRLTLRAVEVDRMAPAALGDADLLRKSRPLVQQR